MYTVRGKTVYTVYSIYNHRMAHLFLSDSAASTLTRVINVQDCISEKYNININIT